MGHGLCRPAEETFHFQYPVSPVRAQQSDFLNQQKITENRKNNSDWPCSNLTGVVQKLVNFGPLGNHRQNTLLTVLLNLKLQIFDSF